MQVAVQVPVLGVQVPVAEPSTEDGKLYGTEVVRAEFASDSR